MLSTTQLVYAASNSDLTHDAQNQDPAAQYQLAQSYELGVDVPHSIDDAFYWYSQSAGNGNPDAQFKLAGLYLTGVGVEQDSKRALEWFIKAALQGHKRAPVEVARIYESSLEEKGLPLLQPLDAAQLWYEAALKDNSDAEEGYNRILEAQFNQQRAKQISSIKQLNSSVDTSNDHEQNVSSLSVNQNSDLQQPSSLIKVTMNELLIAACIALLSVLMTLFITRKKQNQNSVPLSHQQHPLEAQLKAQGTTIKQQKRQLHAMFTELKKQRNSQETQKLQIACSLFGYTPTSIPNQKSIKIRYKQLSKIYHPDGHGCDEEMKRLNNALKNILQNVTKQ
ncbi:J domain-containing protein [Vibrio sp. L3-7]|uniref:J domain-containing protein n=1 Tax=Vibrio sp. L3-7 TaxID=2912253 RepID=UPI00118FE6B0|nr:J domain-containing protein [Vibrio sp. L3-7]MCF7506627.1 J domain-containing protein [Vibrio sp. L3-7]TVU71606.1 J domain-containing protein [Vibrio tasmaniensis]